MFDFKFLKKERERANASMYMSSAIASNDPWSTPTSSAQQSSPWGPPTTGAAASGGSPFGGPSFQSPTANGTNDMNNVDDGFEMLSSRSSPAKPASTTGQHLQMFDPLAGTQPDAWHPCVFLCLAVLPSELWVKGVL